MEPKFILDRDKLSDDEINKGKDFDALLKKFKAESIEKAKSDTRLKTLKRLRYSAIIAGALVVCTVCYFQIKKSNNQIADNSSQVKNKEIISDKNSTSALKPVGKNTLAYKTYKVNSQKGGVLEHPGNSKIKIPKNAFVNKSGESIKGEVEIHYREMRDVADVLASGVPMRYDSAGQSYDLESRGMMDIKGFHKGEPVFIQNGKNLEVEMIAKQKVGTFCNYYLDTVNKNWVYLNPTPEIVVQKIVETKPNSENLKAEIERREKELKESIAVNKSSIVVPEKPRKANPQRKRFVLEVDYKEFPELSAYKNASFEIGEENKNYTSEMSKIEWMDAKISEGPQKGKNYLLTLTYGKRVEKMVVYPVLEGKDLEAANKEYQALFATYQNNLKEKEIEEEKLRKEKEDQLAELKQAYLEGRKSRVSEPDAAATEVAQFFYVNQFGIYNSDCARKKPNQAMVFAELRLGEKLLSPNRIFLFEQGKDQVYTYYQAELQEFKYNPRLKNILIVPIQDKIYLCEADDFNKAKAEDNKKIFQFTEFTAASGGLDELRKKLGLDS